MIDGLIRWSLQNKLIVLTLAAGLLIWGGAQALRLPVDVLPDLTAPTVTILVEGGGMAPEEMESRVTFPIEAALNGAAGVRRVRSVTAVGAVIVWVEFDWGEDIYRARQTVNEKLALVAGTLPDTVEPPVLAPISSIMGEILFVALESGKHSMLDVRATADTVVRRRLLAVPGVSQVTTIGGAERQYQVLVNPERLRSFGVTLDEVEHALRSTDRNTSAGFLVGSGQEYLILGIARPDTVEQIGETVVLARDGRPVRVADLGEVRVGPALRRGEAGYNGRRAVLIGIQKQPGAHTLELTARLDTVLDELQASLDRGLVLQRDVFRQAGFIESAIHNLTRALRDGSLLVVLIVFLFLANLRAASIAVLAMPLSLIASALAIKWSGATINSMTLGGMAIAVGAIVDDAIIDVENVFRRLRENTRRPEGERRPVLEVVYQGSREIRASIVFATLVIALVFLPLFFLHGVEGRLLRPLGFAYLVALTASLVVALTVTPVLCALLLPRSPAVRSGHEPRWLTALKDGYQRLLEGCLRHGRWLLAGSALALALAAASFGWMGRTFLPEFNEGTLTISAVTLPGTSLDESDALGAAAERLLLEVPEVTVTGRRTGRAELDEHLQGVEATEIEVGLHLEERSKEQVLEHIRERLALLPGMNVTVGQPISHRIDHMLSGTRANIAIKLFGPELRELRRLAAQVEAVAREVPGAVDVAAEAQAEIPTIQVKFDRRALARLGQPAGAAAQAMRTAFVGREVGQVYEDQVGFPLVVRYPAEVQESLETIRRTEIDTPSGARVALQAVAEIREDRGANFIGRENGRRKIVVAANVAGRDLRSVVDEIREGVARGVELPPGYSVEYGGQFESEAAASKRLLWLGLTVVLGMLVLLTTAFRSAGDALIVMLNLPLALIGGAIGVFVDGGVLSIASIIGFIALFGIATRNGIMMISHIRHLLLEEGERSFRAAVVRGARQRVVPILMTALSAGLALVPLALAGSHSGAELEAPMAVVILFGLLSATALNMIVVPVAYLRFSPLRSQFEP
ncbi:multidrug transporter AcrB [Acidobacteria bacterium Mor1]|nr:multidrug transporter AcrB [Acidobacteria bacterium Mor1]